MTGRTHVAVGACTATGLCALTDQSLTISAVVIGVAAATSKFPDGIERPFRLDHRTVTHWPLLMGSLALLIALLAPLGAIEAAQAVSHDPSAVNRVEVAAGPLGAMIAAGFAIGTLCHIFGDAMTVGGVPLLGPFSRRDYWLLPKRLRFHVYKHAPASLLLGASQRREPSLADTSIRLVTSLGTVLLALSHFSQGSVP